MSSRVLVVGSGGREHALALALSADPAVGSLVVAPGNAGTEAIAESAQLDATDPRAAVALAEATRADYVLIGPEGPLVAGVADALRNVGIPTFGPSAAAARLEGSKTFAKQVMVEAGVPTSGSTAHTEIATATSALETMEAPYVVKADGLAGGKGVVVTDDRAAAEAHIKECGGLVVLEEFLDGPEVSLFAIVDEAGGIHPFMPAQDHKRVGDGDTGPNTGGMGAYAPLRWAPPELTDTVVASVIAPTVAVMAKRGTPFQGLLYVGLALTGDGPKVIEFNARFGDPETQTVLALQTAPLLGVLKGEREPTWSDFAAVTVVLAAQNYPGTPRLGDPITGLEDAAAKNVTIHHAGTRRVGDTLVSSGGRVLSATGLAADFETARATAYEAMGKIQLPGSHYRRDIGTRNA